MLPLTKQHIVPCLQTGDYSRRGQQGASNHWATKVAGARQRVNSIFADLGQPISQKIASNEPLWKAHWQTIVTAASLVMPW